MNSSKIVKALESKLKDTKYVDEIIYVKKNDNVFELKEKRGETQTLTYTRNIHKLVFKKEDLVRTCYYCEVIQTSTYEDEDVILKRTYYILPIDTEGVQDGAFKFIKTNSYEDDDFTVSEMPIPKSKFFERVDFKIISPLTQQIYIKFNRASESFMNTATKLNLFIPTSKISTFLNLVVYSQIIQDASLYGYSIRRNDIFNTFMRSNYITVTSSNLQSGIFQALSHGLEKKFGYTTGIVILVLCALLVFGVTMPLFLIKPKQERRTFALPPNKIV